MSKGRLHASFPVSILDAKCVTVLGGQSRSLDCLLNGKSGLEYAPVLGPAGGDTVPLGLMSPMTNAFPPRWLPHLQAFGESIPDGPWGTPRYPVIFTSSNFAIDQLLAFSLDKREERVPWCSPHGCAKQLADGFGWGSNFHIYSHACVSAHLGIMHATKMLESNLADRVLLFSFDFLSPFVAGGFHSLKILNSERPAPWQNRPIGAIGLGDAAAFAVLGREHSPFKIICQHLGNEMYHFTSNEPQGSGFANTLAPVREALGDYRFWIKGHGTGTLESGRLEAQSFLLNFPHTPLTGWKGGIGHTLGSCGLVELVLAMEAVQRGQAPGIVGASPPFFSENCQPKAFPVNAYNGVLMASNAFGGAHALLFMTHA